MSQQRGRAALLAAVLQQRIAAAGGVGGDCPQELPELVGAAAVEPAIGAARQLGDLREDARGGAVVAFVEDEHRQAEQAELSRLVADLIDILLAAVADE